MFKKKKKSIIITMALALILIIILSIIVFLDNDSKQDQFLQNINVRLKWLHQSQFAGMYVAEQKGYYKDEGININLNSFDYKHFPIEEVVNGNADFGVTGADELLVARTQGKKIKALAVIYQENPVVAYALKSSEIKEPRDFIGKTIGIESNINVEFNIRAMLAKQGLDYNSDIKVVKIAYDHRPLINGDVDIATGYVTNEPIQAEEDGYPVNIISPSKYGVNLYADVLFTSEEMINNNPDLVQRFVNATLKGWEYAVQNVDEAVKYTLLYKDPNNIALNFNHQEALLKNSLKLVKPSSNVKIGTMSYRRWNAMYNLLKQYKVINSDLDIENAFTVKFLK